MKRLSERVGAGGLEGSRPEESAIQSPEALFVRDG